MGGTANGAAGTPYPVMSGTTHEVVSEMAHRLARRSGWWMVRRMVVAPGTTYR
ncbi:hypothetical protein [Kribbella sp. NPDC006257]|uniref:hypothetical protein n=1 Tax=Kribbella sp. NPDC006257 TaxID=3156738 RepID=UPI0033A2B111